MHGAYQNNHKRASQPSLKFKSCMHRLRPKKTKKKICYDCRDGSPPRPAIAQLHTDRLLVMLHAMATTAAAEQESTMDPELWGNLQNYIDLDIIYAKLPFRHFFQLRVVCKEWNRLASDAAFLNDTYKDFLLPEPYFVLNAYGRDRHVCSLLARDPRTQQWTWTHLPNGSDGFGYVFDAYWSTAGLALSHSLDSQGSRFVFNLHTRHLLRLPPPPEATRHHYPFIGMEVDTAARPYQFRMMQGNDDVATQIYDSRTSTWSGKASQVRGISGGQAMAAFAKGVFLTRDKSENVLIYDPANDEWDHFDTPPDGDWDDFFRGLGTWRDRIFHASTDRKVIRVWELISITERDWTEVATMPGELYSWLLYENNVPPVDLMNIRIIVSFCFQSILIYAWRFDGDASVEGGERFVILDLEKMEFRKLELPFGPFNEKLRSHGDLYAVC